MSQLQVNYPDALPDIARLTREEFERDMRFALAAKLFELGRLSSGQAAQMIPVERYHFLRELHRYRVNMIDWDEEDFDQERRHA